MKEPFDDWAPVTSKGSPNSGWRPLKWALSGAVLAVAGSVVLAALHGLFLGFHPAPIYGSYEAGFEAAATMAVFVFFMGGLPIAAIGFGVGFVVGLGLIAFRKSR